MRWPVHVVRQAHHERAGEGGMSGNQPPVRPELVEGCERMGACIGPFGWFDKLTTNGRGRAPRADGGGGMSGNQPPVRPEPVEGCERMGACVGPFMWFDKLTTNGRGRAPRAGTNHPFVLSLSKDASGWGLALARSAGSTGSPRTDGGGLHERAPTTRSS